VKTVMPAPGQPVPAATRRFNPRRARGGLLVAVLLMAVIASPPVRHRALRVLGASLLISDPIEPGDLLVISEAGEVDEFQAAEIEASELYGRRLFPRVMLLRPAPDAIDEELARRGVRLENPVLATLRQLGIPAAAMIVLDAGEGGTTDSTQALAGWVRAHPARVLVVVGAAHSRRYRRALLRVWPANAPAPRVTYPRHTAFRADGWWTSRRRLREGLFELQKLALDCVRHPW
jgi:hypothetical protein